MTEKDIREIFEKLNIVEEPLSSNYDPDDFARHLMNTLNTEEISYAMNTTLNAFE